MSRDVPVKGLKELDAYLSALPKNMQKGAYRAGLVAAAAVIRDEARMRAPRKSGKLVRSIRSGSARQNADGTFSITVGPRGKDHAFLGLFHEFGVRPHFIARTGKGEGRVAIRKAKEGEGTINARVMKIGSDFVSGVISHPGFTPQPFLRPALDIKADEAVKAFAERIRDYIEGKTGFAAPLDEAA
jgi:HK97 gp10 family phage protein